MTALTSLPPLMAMAAQLALLPPSGMPPAVAEGLREIGARIDGANTAALYAPLHAALKHDAVQVRRDQAYGPHERHRADVFLPAASGAARPMIVFVHGGGFSRGARTAAGQFYYDNIGYWAAENGLVGVTINYRLAPEFKYPAGAQDVERLVAYLREQARGWGADPARIFLWGHSAGGAHVADYLVRTANPPVAGAVLTSPVLTAVPTWKDYYGEDATLYPQRSALDRLIQVPLPLLVNWAELDPPDFIPDTEKLVAGRQAAGRPITSLRLPNHSHISETFAIGTADQSLSGPVLRFVTSGSNAP